MNNCRHLACLFVLISCICARAQTPLKGYIVTLQGDTVKGYLIDRIDARLSKEVEFLKEEKSNKISYSPSNLKAFGFDNGRSFKQRSYSDSAGVQYFFAKRIVQGKVDMYIRRKVTNDQPDIYLTNNSSHVEVVLFPPSRKFIEDSKGRKYTPDQFKHLSLLDYVKGDPPAPKENEKKLRYIEKDIQRHIAEYNKLYSGTFPTKVYRERPKFSYDVTGGLPLEIYDHLTHFRVAFYRTKSFPEKSRTVSFISGASYRYWGTKSEYDTWREQTISIIPIGINVHTARGFIRPYFYAGGGALFLIDTDDANIENVVKTKIYFYPAINVGAGIKLKVGSKFILAELTPSLSDRDIFVNVGFSF